MINIVIPMAGKGSRFLDKGYTFPKPLIEIFGKPMIQVVVENLKMENRDYRFIFIVQEEHYKKYALHEMLNFIAHGCETVKINGITEGAACTVLLTKEYINNDDELIIANSDQYIDNDFNKFIEASSKDNIDGLIMTFKSVHPKWSYAKLDKNNFVVEVAEKKPISDNATVGIYYFRKGKDFVQAAEKMIEKDIRVNNEFYVCPVYNEMILMDKKIKTYDIKQQEMYGLGTPEDLDKFIKDFQEKQI